MVTFRTGTLSQTKHPPVQRQSVGQGLGFVRSPYGPRSRCRVDLPRHALDSGRQLGELKSWTTEILENCPPGQNRSFPVPQLSGGPRGELRARTRRSVAPYRACHSLPRPPPRPRRRPLRHAAGLGISTVLGQPGVPPAARGKCGRQAYSTTLQKWLSQQTQTSQHLFGISIGAESMDWSLRGLWRHPTSS